MFQSDISGRPDFVLSIILILFTVFFKDNRIMKDMNVLKMIVVAFAIVAMSSCATTTQKINDLVDDTVRNSENLTEEEWAERDSRLEELLRQYESNPDAFSEEERQSIDYALGQYYGAQVKQGLQDAKRGIEDFLDQLPGFIDGFIDGTGLDTPTDSL